MKSNVFFLTGVLAAFVGSVSNIAIADVTVQLDGLKAVERGVLGDGGLVDGKAFEDLIAQIRQLDGGQDSGGGNAYEAEFRSIAQDVLRRMTATGSRIDELGFRISDFERAVRDVIVLGTNRVIRLEGLDRSAMNSLNQRVIVFNNQVWSLLNEEQKQMLVVHEYLRFVGVNDSDYAYTMRVVQSLNISNRQNGPGYSRRARSYEIIRHEGSCGFKCQKRQLFTLRNGDQLEMDCQMSTLMVYLRSPNGTSLRFEKTFTGQDRFDACSASIGYAALATPAAPVFLVIDPLGDQYSGVVSFE